MKFSEEMLQAFDLEIVTEKEPVNVMQIKDMLAFMKLCSERIAQKSKCYLETTDAEIQMDCMDIVTAKLNDFAQVFCDLVIFLRKQEGSYKGGESLRYCLTSYNTFDFSQTESEKNFLQELVLRNEITHDYFNREMHQQKLVWIMTNCSDGAVDIYENLYHCCKEHKLMDLYADKVR